MNNFKEKIISKNSIIPFLLDNKYVVHKEMIEMRHHNVIFKSKQVVEISPNDEKLKNPPLILSVGIHGNETAPIEIVSEILVKILTNKVKVMRPTLILFGNIPAMIEQQRFLDFNLNRLFNKEHQKHPDAMESEIALKLENEVEKFYKKFKEKEVLHLDLHTAIKESHHQRFAISPVGNTTNYSNTFKAMDIDALIQSSNPSNTFSDFTSRIKNANAFTLELGKVMPFGENDLNKFSNAKKTIIDLLEYREIETSNKKIILYSTYKEIIKDNDSFQFIVKENEPNFNKIPPGTPVYEQDNKTHSFDKETYLLFANSRVKEGQRAALLLQKTDEL